MATRLSLCLKLIPNGSFACSAGKAASAECAGDRPPCGEFRWVCRSEGRQYIDAIDPEAVRGKIDHRYQASPKQLAIQAATSASLHQGRFSSDYMLVIWTRPCTLRSYPIASRSYGLSVR
jgi:hypothetical protein